MNLVVVSGHLSSEPSVRELKSGSILVTYELTTQVVESESAKPVGVSVPLVWFDPPKKVTVGAGDEIAAVGTVRRRFYRAGGTTQSRTEVVVQHLARVGDKRAVAQQRRLIASAIGPELLEGLRSP